MYAIYGNIYHPYTPNVSIYAIHGSYGINQSFHIFTFIPIIAGYISNQLTVSRLSYDGWFFHPSNIMGNLNFCRMTPSFLLVLRHLMASKPAAWPLQRAIKRIQAGKHHTTPWLDPVDPKRHRKFSAYFHGIWGFMGMPHFVRRNL